MSQYRTRLLLVGTPLLTGLVLGLTLAGLSGPGEVPVAVRLPGEALQAGGQGERPAAGFPEAHGAPVPPPAAPAGPLAGSPPAGGKRGLPAVLRSPADDVKLARADAESLDPEVAYYTRYLSRYNAHPEDRPDWDAVLDFTLNSLSVRRKFAYGVVVPGSDGSLFRVNLRDYGISPEAWDTLGAKGSGPIRSVAKKDQPDPYFHLLVQVPTKKQKVVKKEVKSVDAAGKTVVKVVEEKVDAVETVARLDHAAWIDPADITPLAACTHTDFPVFRADWFLANALIAPAYNEFFGFKKLEDVQYLARFRERDEDLATDGVVTRSRNVALHQRAIRFITTSTGQWSETSDYLTSIDGDDLLADLLVRRRDAAEIIFSLPNTLQGYALINDSTKNDVIDVALTAVATDKRTSWRDPGVWTAISCITCHTAGMQEVDDKVRLLSSGNMAAFLNPERYRPKDIDRIIDLYSTPVEEPVARGQAIYARAVNVVTRGWDAAKLAARVEREFVKYVQDPIDLEAVAYEAGFPPDFIADLLSRTRGPDHTLSQLLKEDPVRRDQWESKGFAQVIIACRADARTRAAQGGGGE